VTEGLEPPPPAARRPRTTPGARTPRVPRSPPRAPDLESRDPSGRMALFSSLEPQPEPSPIEFVVIECSSCLKETRTSPLGLARAVVPFALFLPLVRSYPAWVRCPACGRRTWVRLSVRL
jgi:hypothetical protein